MKLKEFHSLMQDIAPFARPKPDLEQYPTGPHLASRLMFAVDSSYDELRGRVVVDLGCGTAMLSIGAALLGAGHVVGVDIDPEALATAADNVGEFEEPLQIDLVLADVRHLPEHLPYLRADTVIMNPPFGTKQKGVDMLFLAASFSIATGAVYSLHKSSTRAHIAKTVTRDFGASRAEVVAQLRYDLPATMKFHKQKSVDIEVDLWRFEVGPGAASRTAPAFPPPRAQLSSPPSPPPSSSTTTVRVQGGDPGSRPDTVQEGASGEADGKRGRKDGGDDGGDDGGEEEEVQR